RGGGGFGVHGGGRGGGHEHHAGGGDGAHPRNRHSQVRGRAPPGHAESVPGGIVDAGGHRRGSGSHAGLDCGGAGAEPDAGAHVRARERGGGGRDALRGGGAVLRHLPGAAGRQTRSHRGPEDGKMTLVSIGNGIRLALATTREHKMRSFLTILGVIIGTGAVIGVGSIIAGLDGAITNLLRSFGPNTIIVLKGKAMGDWTREERRRKPL